MKTISAAELKKRLDNGEDIQILDIRESHEVESGNLGGLHIPMADVMKRKNEIRRDCPVVVHCKSGSRASAMAYALSTECGFDNIFHLEGGIEAWANKVDPNITVY